MELVEQCAKARRGEVACALERWHEPGWEVLGGVQLERQVRWCRRMSPMNEWIRSGKTGREIRHGQKKFN